MAQVADVARQVLDIKGPVTSMKLEKLVFYAQAYSLAKRSAPMFTDRIEAWVNGPVVPALYRLHRGMFMVWPESIPQSSGGNGLTQDEKAVVARVVDKLGDYTGEELRALTHSERPWLEARGELGPADRGSKEITQESMSSYYRTPLAGNPLFE